MSPLIIPESGVSLEISQGSFSKPGPGIPDVVGLTLTDGVIEEMIKCVQNGKPIQLSFGDYPSISYGTKTQHFMTTEDPFNEDVYESTMTNSNTSGNWFARSLGVPNWGMSKKPPAKSTNKPVTNTSKPSVTAGTDAALAALQSSLATENAKKQENSIKYFKDGLPAPGRKGAAKSNKSKFLSQNHLGADTTRSMPSSPSLNGVGSPSLNPTSVPLSQQQAEKSKGPRKSLIHLLALEPMTEKVLIEKVPDTPREDLMQALEKVGDLNETTGKWELRKKLWKELDVWSFKYDSQEDRQKVIDNAVEKYDKMRLGLSDPEWDRLLVKAERGTNKCLSKLQARIAQGPVARPPKINVQKADGSGRDTPTGDESELFGDKNLSKVKGENRSSSQPPTTKNKKVSEKEAQAKRLLGKTKATPKPAPKAAPKAAATKKAAPLAKTGGKVLSSEFVGDSDEDDHPAPPPKPRPTKAPVKRSREAEYAETSDSSEPLSKKVKKDAPVSNHRVSNASQISRTTNSSHSSLNSIKSKGTSPQKSSPLASSPPTNASEFDNSSGGRTSSSASPARISNKNSRSPIHKRQSSRSPVHKRHQKSSSVTSSTSSTSSNYLKPAVMDLAKKFKVYYPKYEALHKEIFAQGEKKDAEMFANLMEMHHRLDSMKRQIWAGQLDGEDSQ